MSSGYKGFKSWGGQECPSLKPGESYDARATKFSQMGSNIVQNQATNTAIRIVNPSFEAVTRSHFGHVTKHDYENPARPASRGREIANSRTFLGQTLYQNDFLNFQDEGRRIAALPAAVYAASFDQLATVPNQDPTPSDSDLFKLKRLARDDVKTLLRQVYGKPPTSRILEIYAHMFDACPDGFISWDVFQEAVARLASFLLHQTIKISGQAGWFDFVAAKQMLPGGTPASSHQLDFGTYGSEPLARPYIGRTNGMASTTTDLFDGTTKATFHIPRYQGFIPQTKYNPTAVAQGDGEQTRGKEEDLRLYHLNNLPGYTGHKPVDSKNVRGEAKTGTDSRTTNGFVYKPHNLNVHNKTGAQKLWNIVQLFLLTSVPSLRARVFLFVFIMAGTLGLASLSPVQHLLARMVRGKLAHGAIALVAADSAVHRCTMQRIWKSASVDLNDPRRPCKDPTSRMKARVGRKAFHRSVADRLREIPKNRRTTIRSVGAAMGTSRSSLHRYYKRGVFVKYLGVVKPALTEANKIVRLKWALDSVQTNAAGGFNFSDMMDTVHVDEKMFFATCVKKTFYLAPGEEPPHRTAKSKRHIIKVMFLSAVARPRWDYEKNQWFDGKIGMWQFTEWVPAKRTSRRRVAGTMVMTPALWPKHESRRIMIQQDNARPHVAPLDSDIVAACAAGG
ncbi:hypothetical protein, variant [Aphanomyces astaci]|uniref:DUF7769 domain-containing protein n=1 Tax=Aphanomyces astaci TaxID=112090 RepID=W4FW33_APHAT|nr:hypothetical protein, variant [Aphanomyces astaci]ETV71735.1 hypothetical protein, variant [Aphanomyces astaci]|eukprot:XP_009838923.1 hypothetical protein, variant [Aphanomyces astaci]